MPDPYVVARQHVVEMLLSLLDSRQVVMLSRADDQFPGVACEVWSGSYRKHGLAQTSGKSDPLFLLEGAIEACMPFTPRMKVCIRDTCLSKGALRPLWWFGPDRDAKDGHAAVCKSCEGKRVGGYGKRKAERKRAEQERLEGEKGK